MYAIKWQSRCDCKRNRCFLFSNCDSFLDLDSIFGELPPKSLIKTSLLFAKPPPPKMSYKPSSRLCPLSINKQVSS